MTLTILILATLGSISVFGLAIAIFYLMDKNINDEYNRRQDDE